MLIKIDENLLDFPRSREIYVRMSEVSHFEVDSGAITFHVSGKTITVGRNQAGKMYNNVLAQLNKYVEECAV